ncbi:MAG: peptidase domain-containing ABC transporter [Cytophagales bacterium]|nr:peptidase domain-containing ABC transporter [Cytophagales bacterium]
MKKFPSLLQTEEKDCGPTCIKIIGKYYGRDIETQQLRDLAETTREGSNLFGLSEAVEKIGFRSLGLQLNYEQLLKAKVPCIVHWNGSHYVVVYRIKKDKVYVSDPGYGLVTYDKKEFISHWTHDVQADDTNEGIALVLEPTPAFYQEEFHTNAQFGVSYITKYLLKYRRFIVQLILGLLAGSLLQLILPFLTQSVVDVGISNLDLNFIYLILVAQLSLNVGKALLEVIRSWILLHLTTRINIELVSDFFIKLMKLPISYFDVRITGDLMQRINDHKRIEQVLTTNTLTTIFSGFNLIIFSAVLLYYSGQIFMVFVLGSALYFGWILFFFKKRRELDYKKFSRTSKEQSKVIELINGMQEIKLHTAERRMRWSWEHLQASLFKVATKSLSLEQTQSVGSNFINEIKNMIITILAAKLVIEGDITLGMMLAVSYIVGQMDGPIAQLIYFFRNLQDARISIERLAEIHHMEDEEPADKPLVRQLPERGTIKIDDISFRYKGTDNMLFESLSLDIPEKKVTAIVGSSGSGKTTLMKLLLRFYAPLAGKINIGDTDLEYLSQETWRRSCGVVMQEGFIFNDSIARNIAVGEDQIDQELLIKVAEMANIKPFVQSLPLGFDTEIGSEGLGLSTGQKQRVLIARALYKQPQYMFFDEATSALDARNEREVMEKLEAYFKNRTAVVIAHRLSTVKNADQIVVLEQGQIVEKGTHLQLVGLKGRYFELVKNQLELDN